MRRYINYALLGLCVTILTSCEGQRQHVRTPVITADCDDDGYISDEEYDQFQKKAAINDYNYQAAVRAEEERRARNEEVNRQIMDGFRVMAIGTDKSATQSEKLKALLDLNK